ncbi:hypothetical protein N0V83_001032 [Neocucurbitaria cava]|uniref:Uncharacterized protein n=1 Tax=Neocucurbitaria cava TaxID=798079 RepID=A0A9W9CQ34_9PLEO|nr:hypothetical protein N0V83_001032 [Neocucurbitaria cava]
MSGNTPSSELGSMNTLPSETEPLLHNRASDPEDKTGSRDDESVSMAETSTKNDFDSDFDSDDDEAEIKKKREQRLKETGGWLGYLRDFGLFLPYLIPRNDIKVQLCIVVSLLALAGQRVLNILVAHQLGLIADKILDRTPPYKELAVWFVLSAMNDNSGLGMIEQIATVPVKQFSERQVTNAAFSHVLSL